MRLTAAVVAGACVLACGCAKQATAPVCNNTYNGTGAPLGPPGIAVDPTYVYWTIPDGNGAVWRQPQAGGAAELFAELGGYPRALASDGGALYVAGGCEGTVWRVPLDGSTPALLAQLPLGGDTCIHGIAVDAQDVYFTTGGVWKVPLTGGDPVELVAPLPGGDGCNGTLAASATDLYWTSPCSTVDSSFAAVSTVPIAGGATTAVDPGVSTGDALALAGGDLYWAADGYIDHRALAGGSDEIIAQLDPIAGGPYAIAVDDSRIYWTTDHEVMFAPRISGVANLFAMTAGPAGVAVGATAVFWAGGDDCPAQSMTR